MERELEVQTTELGLRPSRVGLEDRCQFAKLLLDPARDIWKLWCGGLLGTLAELSLQLLDSRLAVGDGP
jgi:hypothetical protein